MGNTIEYSPLPALVAKFEISFVLTAKGALKSKNKLKMKII